MRAATARVRQLKYQLRAQAAAAVSAKVTRTPDKRRLRFVTVRGGDSLWGLAQRYHVSLHHLERWNHLHTDSVIPIGVRLTVNDPNPSPPHVPTKLKPHTTSTKSGSSTQLATRSEAVSKDVAAAVTGLAVIDYAQQFLGARQKHNEVTIRTA